MEEIQVGLGRRISLENAEHVGHGFFSDVYRIDPETVVKVLKTGTTQDAEREIRLSKWALLNGIPTAISYDVADIDGHPGLVYELLGRGSLREQLLDHPEDFDRRMRQYIDLLHSIHAVTDTERRLPKAVDQYWKELKTFTWITDEERAKMYALLNTIPETDHVVHRDCHFKNIKVVNDEMMLIDLDTLSRGDPIFDMVSLCNSYSTFNEARNYNDLDPFFDMPVAAEKRILDTLLSLYFPDLSETELAENVTKIRVLSYWSVMQFIENYEGNIVYDMPKILGLFRQCLWAVNDLRLVY